MAHAGVKVMRRILCGVLLALGLLNPAGAQEDFPNRQIRLIVVFAPGGGAPDEIKPHAPFLNRPRTAA